ncbi:DUF4435 domain-containing protein [Azospirillum sp. BE72]|uniref:DUF4435 domain-containing protein n=1 Tax=Azospirillum sp. BE72 TaxID=2817776 RepID=UPI0028613795|nr:DUF4435 domain-containing protein [Azospirillum sp. BE72]MDR6771778.1 hypothetical protein [Azospirillum sp. BE72]
MSNRPLFSRTRSGQNNYAIFARVSLVIYCEGGKGIEPSNLASGASNDNAEDLVFWETMFHKFVPGRTFHFKPIGDCQNVSAKAEEIINQNLRNTIAILDRDWNDYRNGLKQDDRIIYTFGYAWENDLVKPLLVAKTVRAICQCSANEYPNHYQEFSKTLNEFTRLSWVLLHLQLQSDGCNCGICPTDQNFGGAISKFDDTGIIDRKSMINRLKRNKHKYVKRRHIPSQLALSTRLYPGHSLMGLVIKYVSRKAKSYGRKSISNDEIISQILSIFSEREAKDLSREERKYYEDRIVRAFTASAF